MTYRVPRTFEVDDHKLTVPVDEAVNLAYNKWLEKHTDELVELFEPFGLHPYEMPMPELRRFVTFRDAEYLSVQFECERSSLAREQDKEFSDG